MWNRREPRSTLATCSLMWLCSGTMASLRMLSRAIVIWPVWITLRTTMAFICSAGSCSQLYSSMQGILAASTGGADQGVINRLGGQVGAVFPVGQTLGQTAYF